MKIRSNIPGNWFLMAILSLFIFSAVSCEEDDDPTIVFKATINGSSEVPPNGSVSTGDATLTYDTVTKKFDIVVNYTGITPTGAHIHLGAAGTSGGVVFGFPEPLTSPIVYSSPVLTTAQEADLFGELYYVNIHSTAYPEGEIRGQLIRQP